MATKKKKPRTAAQKAATARMLAANKRARSGSSKPRKKAAAKSNKTTVVFRNVPAAKTAPRKKSRSGGGSRGGWKEFLITAATVIMLAIINSSVSKQIGPMKRGLAMSIVGGGFAIWSKNPKLRAGGLGGAIVGLLVAMSAFMDDETFMRGPGSKLSQAELLQIKRGIQEARNSAAARYGVPASARMQIPARGDGRMGMPAHNVHTHMQRGW